MVPTLPKRTIVAASLLGLLARVPAFGQILTVTSSPDPTRIEAGVTTLELKATIPAWVSTTTHRLSVWFRRPEPLQGYDKVYSPPTTVDAGTTGAFAHDFPVPSTAGTGKCSAYARLEIHYFDWEDPKAYGDNDEFADTPEDETCLDVHAPKLHLVTPGPIGDAHHEQPVISPPPRQKPPEEEPRPYHEARAAAASRPQRMRNGDILRLRDERVLTVRDGRLVVLDQKGEVLRSFARGSRVVIGAEGELSVRRGLSVERVGVLRR